MITLPRRLLTVPHIKPSFREFNKFIGANKKPPAKADSDLVSSMAARLKQLEATCHSQREEIKEKVRKTLKTLNNIHYYLRKIKKIGQLNEELALCKTASSKEAVDEIKGLKVSDSSILEVFILFS